MRYRLASTVPGMNPARANEGSERAGGVPLRLVSVGTEVLSTLAPQSAQKGFPSG